jgi:glycerophosphoryl diester phosphodiesterase
VTIPEMNEKCTTPWSPGVEPMCCTSDFTLEELKTLCAKMDASGSVNGTAEEYAFDGTPSFRTDLYASPDAANCPTIPTHAESLELMASHGVYFTPELKSPDVEMPFTAEDGTSYTQDDYRQALVDEYIAANIPPEQVRVLIR